MCIDTRMILPSIGEPQIAQLGTRVWYVQTYERYIFQQ
jgi:hypothetical protein